MPKCNGLCWYAKSPPEKCRCECGGANHGKGNYAYTNNRYKNALPVCTPVRVKDHSFVFIVQSEPYEYQGKLYIDLKFADTKSNKIGYSVRMNEIERCEFCKYLSVCDTLFGRKLQETCVFTPSRFIPREIYEYEGNTR